jgi:Kdo2-lipid IVA lauroyltransferase/acyltransferase
MGASFTTRLASAATRCGFAVGCFAIRVLPRHWLFRLADGLASLAYLLFKGFRSRSRKNIAAAFDEKLSGTAVENIARRSLRNFFRDCVEIGIVLESSDEEVQAQVSIIGKEYLNTALEKGSGVVVLSAHLGNFFLLGTRLAVDGYPVFVLVNQPSDGQFAELMDRYRLKVKQRTIHARPRRAALKQLNEILRRNEIAIVIADEYRRGNGIPVPLFGHTVLARRGPATLALRTGAAVVPACLVRQADDSLQLVIEPELEFDRSGTTKAQVTENTVRLTRWLESTVRRYPDQWNWMNIHWWQNTNTETLQRQRVERGEKTSMKGETGEKQQEGSR